MLTHGSGRLCSRLLLPSSGSVSSVSYTHLHGILEEGKFLGAHGSEARVLGGCRHAVANDLLGKAFAHRRNGADAAAQLPVLVPVSYTHLGSVGPVGGQMHVEEHELGVARGHAHDGVAAVSYTHLVH